MINLKKRSWVVLIVASCIFFFIHSCVDPVEPEFDFEDEIIFIDAFALTEKGLSSVSIKRSIFENERYRTETIRGAVVKFENTNSGEIIDLYQDINGVYFSPIDFAVRPGESWKLQVTLLDGRRYESAPEKVTEAVPIEKVTAEYSDEIVFDIGFDRFIPGHQIFIEWNDPEDEQNFYLWKTRSFEILNVCQSCDRSHLRGGVCTDITSGAIPPYYDYLCDTTCWKIRYGEALEIFDDRFSNGTTVTNRPITILPYFRSEDILIEVQQLSLTSSAYQYFEVIKNITTESGGLNAPPPAALLGNLFNPDDPNDPVLGQFTATSVATKSLYIDRSDISEPPLTPDRNIRLENCIICPDSLIYFPCMENQFRTSIKPEGWQ